MNKRFCCFILFLNLFLFFSFINYFIIVKENINEKFDDNLFDSIEFDPLDYEVINFGESDIVIAGDVISKVTQNRVNCYIDITYPKLNESWNFILPKWYNDASNYFIQRDPYNVHYPLEEEHITYTGYDTHWDFSIQGNHLWTGTDRLNFTIKCPVAIWDSDLLNSNVQHKEYLIIYEHYEQRHPFNNVIFNHQIPKPFNNFRIQIFNETGFLNDNITDTSSYSADIISTSFGDFVDFNFDLGNMKNETWYQYRIIFDALASPLDFFENWWSNLVLPFIFGFVIGGSFPFVFTKKKDGTTRTESENIRIAIILGIVFGIFTIVIFYYMRF